MNDIMLVVSEDLNFRLALEAMAQEYNVDCFHLALGEHLTDAVKRFSPFLLVVDFSAEGTEWIMKHMTEVKADHPNFPIIGIISGGLDSDFIRMEKAGCNHVLKKSQYQRKLPSLIEQHLR